MVRRPIHHGTRDLYLVVVDKDAGKRIGNGRGVQPEHARAPTHQAEDIGARFVAPSSLTELTRTTGVPK